jgi:uncharacterized membrane protein
MKLPKWLLLALLVPILWGVWGAPMEIPEKLIHPSFPSTLGYVVWSLTMIPFAIIAIRNAHWKLELDSKSILYGCAVGFSGAMGQLLLFCVLTKGPAYIISPIICLSPVVTIILSATLLKEAPLQSIRLQPLRASFSHCHTDSLGHQARRSYSTNCRSSVMRTPFTST